MSIHKRGRQSFVLPQLPVSDCWASVVGKKDSEGPLADTFDVTSQDTRFGQPSWEQAEKYMQQTALQTLLRKAKLNNDDVDLVLSGHYHGGQIRIPLVGGIYAPEAGLFPDYTEGMYVGTQATCVLSTGLGASIGIPRFNNLPQMTVVDLM